MNSTQDTFIFEKHTADITKGTASFHFRVYHDGQEYAFVETVTFPPVVTKIPETLLTTLLDNLLLVLGVSYWKLFCPKTIVIQPFALSEQQAKFWNMLYTKGLGEFFYQNNIHYPGLIEFPYKEQGLVSRRDQFLRQDRSLLLIGAGKDSILSGEMLKKAHKLFTAFVVNPKQLHKDTIHILNVGNITFRRSIDYQVLALNKQPGTYNGHVPATAINSFLGIFAAVLYDYRYVILSNEKSANYGNVTYLGQEINHQWSKSEEFEQLFQQYISRYLTHDVTYFSLLRPFTEIMVTKLFSRYGQYFPYFSSCNRNFTIIPQKQLSKNRLWCGACPKCLFVFTMLAAFIPKEQVLTIFGKNLFEDTHLERFFRELLGIGEIKPFECVGTPDEMRYALYMIHKKGEFGEASLMKIFLKEAMPGETQIQELEKGLFQIKRNFVPKEFIKVIEKL